MNILEFLSENRIDFQRVEHPPVFTCEEAERIVPRMPGADTKNLFLRDKKGRRHFLVVVGYDKAVNLKALSAALGVSNLSLASAERLKTYLGIEPGSVSLLAIINDTAGAVDVVFDEALWNADILKCHPLINTSTLAIKRAEVVRFFEIIGRAYSILSVPGTIR